MSTVADNSKMAALDGLATRAESFREWRTDALARGVLPTILIAGSRGKSTVTRLLATMLGDQWRVALRHPDGVSIQGELQEGEIEPWERVESMLRAGDLDVALWEVDWPTAVALPASMNIATLAITNVCANREECMIYGDAKLAMKSLPVLLRALPEGGTLILNGEDFLVSDLQAGRAAETIFVGQGIESPAMEQHWQQGGACAWVESDYLCLGHRRGPARLLQQNEVGFALGGVASFEIQNALMASAIAYSLGIRTSTIANVLREFRSDIRTMPGSFNVMYSGGVPTIVDRPAPSWFLRPVVRALRDYRHARLLTVIGRLEGVPSEDFAEVGRLLGRVSSALFVATGRATDGYDWSLIREGANRNAVPPVVLPFSTEEAAFRKASTMARAADTIFYISAHPEQIQAQWQSTHPTGLEPGADAASLVR